MWTDLKERKLESCDGCCEKVDGLATQGPSRVRKTVENCITSLQVSKVEKRVSQTVKDINHTLSFILHQRQKHLIAPES